jgi:hypothetical protein
MVDSNGICNAEEAKYSSEANIGRPAEGELRLCPVCGLGGSRCGRIAGHSSRISRIKAEQRAVPVLQKPQGTDAPSAARTLAVNLQQLRWAIRASHPP